MTPRNWEQIRGGNGPLSRNLRSAVVRVHWYTYRMQESAFLSCTKSARVSTMLRRTNSWFRVGTKVPPTSWLRLRPGQGRLRRSKGHEASTFHHFLQWSILQNSFGHIPNLTLLTLVLKSYELTAFVQVSSYTTMY